MVAFNSGFSVFWDCRKSYAYVSDITDRQFVLVMAINSLPQTFRQALILFAFERRSRQDIADIFFWPTESVTVVLSLCGTIIEKSCRNFKSDIPEHAKLSTRLGAQFAVYGELVALKYQLKPQMELL